jgi:hypothetical protein
VQHGEWPSLREAAAVQLAKRVHPASREALRRLLLVPWSRAVSRQATNLAHVPVANLAASAAGAG